MMKEVCAQCLQRHVDPATGRRRRSSSPASTRTRSSTRWTGTTSPRACARTPCREKLTNLWLERLFSAGGPEGGLGVRSPASADLGRERAPEGYLVAVERIRERWMRRRRVPRARDGLRDRGEEQQVGVDREAGLEVVVVLGQPGDREVQVRTADDVSGRADVADDVALGDRWPGLQALRVPGEVAVEEEVLAGRVLLVDRDAAALLAARAARSLRRRSARTGVPRGAPMSIARCCAYRPRESRNESRRLLAVHALDRDQEVLGRGSSERSTSSGRTRAVADLGRRNDPSRRAILAIRRRRAAAFQACLRDVLLLGRLGVGFVDVRLDDRILGRTQGGCG